MAIYHNLSVSIHEAYSGSIRIVPAGFSASGVAAWSTATWFIDDTWADQAHQFGIKRGQPRLYREHPGGHRVAPVADYAAAIDWVLEM